jgi:hypothetical protein
MQKLHFSIVINAPKEKVWNTMLDDATYREWTSVFNPQGSYYEGNWKSGSKMLFIGPDENGKLGGMVSRIKENRPHEYLSIEHIGILQDGKKDTTSDAAKKWIPAFESYTFRETEGKTEVLIDVDIIDEYVKLFQGMWPKALLKLKHLAEVY